MSGESSKPAGPDFTRGVDVSQAVDGDILTGHVDGEPVILVRDRGGFFAIGAECTHQGGPLAEGVLVDGAVRCPWHHACFDLRSGLPTRAPALKPVACYRVIEDGGVVRVTSQVASPAPPASTASVQNIVIIGGGAAGNAAAQTLRYEGYSGNITMLSADSAAPYDRTNLSKGVLSGNMSEDGNSLQVDDFYRENSIDLRLETRVERIDTTTRQVETGDGNRYPYDALLLATGSSPVQLDIPGATLPHVHYLRSADDCHRLLQTATSAKRAVIIGASFIGLEVAACLRARGIEVQIAGLETTLMEKVLGPEVGRFLQQLHEDHGVIFHLGTTASTINSREVVLTNEETLPTDIVVVGIGVRPQIRLAEQAGLATDRGVLVDEYLQTSAPGIFAAGDIARWPDPFTGERLRIEHWVVAERQGQTAARNMMGQKERFEAVPFFWTEQYDFGLSYVGHAAHFDKVDIEGDLGQRDATIHYRYQGRELACAFVHRDVEGLHKELEYERAIAAITLGQP